MVYTCSGSISNSGASKFTNSAGSIQILNYNRILNGDNDFYVNNHTVPTVPTVTNTTDANPLNLVKNNHSIKKRDDKKRHDKKRHDKKRECRCSK